MNISDVEKERVLYDDDNCLVLNKKIGESCENAAPAEGGQFIEACHRLDMPVSGCVLFAKTKEALTFYNDLFAKGAIQKRYWAIVEKNAEIEIEKEARLVHWLTFDTKHNKARAFFENVDQGKKSLLDYRVLGEGDNYIFLDIDLLTGRHHQIRAQLAVEGLHVKGDLKYGAKRSEKEGGIRLHCYSLVFPKYGGAEKLDVFAPPPLEDSLWLAVRNCSAKRS
jgi:23S rRNA pseudouridine1911/1915/1917 synthase